MPANVRYADLSAGLWRNYVDSNVVIPPDPPEPFIYGETVPFNDDPYNPIPAYNVGWDGTIDLTTTGDVTMPNNATWTNRVIYGNVTLGTNSTLQNCIIHGSAAAPNKPALVRVPAGGTLRRCTIVGNASSLAYQTNCLTMTGGSLLTLDRNVFWRSNDHVKLSGSGVANSKLVSTGNLYKEYAFWDNDADHATGTPPYWSHNDAIQMSAASSQQHVLLGDKYISYFDCEGVVWSGGSFGVGQASGGTVGRPATALNGGYWRLPYPEEVAKGIEGRGTFANGVTFSNVTGFKASIEKCWIDGVNAGSGLIQFTVGASNVMTLKGNRFGLGGKRSGAGTLYLVSYKVGDVATIGTGADANIYDDLSSVPTALRGTPLTFTSTGAKITL